MANSTTFDEPTTLPHSGLDSLPGGEGRGGIDPQAALRLYRDVRSFSERLCEPLATEDFVIQPMPDCSPTKWHLAHTSWFFETFVLKDNLPGYQSLHPQYDYLFNSYYNAIGARHCRPKRGLISRPSVAETYAYRTHVDRAVEEFLVSTSADRLAAVMPILTLGLHHEQQHQELMLTDIKNVFWENPLRPAYHPFANARIGAAGTLAGMEIGLSPSPLPFPVGERGAFVAFEGGLVSIGHEGVGFAFDNEGPRHQTFVQPFAIADRLVTAAEYLAFIDDGGYRRPEFWLSEGWTAVQALGWQAPLYWERHDGDWWQFTLSGMRPVDHAEPVCHVSFFEAEAYAAWAGARLATEAEWELVAGTLPVAGNFADDGLHHPARLDSLPGREGWGGVSISLPGGEGRGGVGQFYGDVWEWTSSAYSPYPGYRAAPGALGEYNGKFMCNQYVLRGGSCATHSSHIRPTYRNFFPADARWQFSGIRLAKETL